MQLFITGNSSGLGHALTRVCLERGDTIYGLSRRGCEDLDGDLFDQRCDLADLDCIDSALADLLGGVGELDAVILNAGILGQIKDLTDTPQTEIDHIMRINAWSNKVILDWLIRAKIRINQIVLISSGAAINGGAGWGGYSLSKATLNMLTQLYAYELPKSHLISLAPGLVDTAMQQTISDPGLVDIDKYPGFQRLRDVRKGGEMPSAMDVARRIIRLLPELTEFPSGSFVDIRNL
jgi:NAD(P)-dependent dehydrogenase (short-subunit alcohol dehydrogenase family)